MKNWSLGSALIVVGLWVAVAVSGLIVAIAGVLWWGAPTAAQLAQSQQTQASLDAEINTDLPSTNRNVITAAALRQVLHDLNAAIFSGLSPSVSAPHSVLIGEGAAPIAGASTGTAGRLLFDQGAGADPSFQAVSGDITCTAAGVCTLVGGGGINQQTSNYTVATTDCGKTIQAGTGSTGLFTLTLPSAAGFSPGCVVSIKNGDAGRGKVLSGFPSDFGAPTGSILWPLQSGQVKVVSGAWATLVNPGLWISAQPTLQVNHGSGSDTNNDCLGTGAGACATITHAVALMQGDTVCGAPTIQLAAETFQENVVILGPSCPAGRNIITIIGNEVTPANVVWQPTNGAGNIAMTCFDQNWCIVAGITFSGTAASQTALQAGKGGFLGFRNVAFGVFNSGIHLQANYGGIINYESGTYTVSGTPGLYHAYAYANGIINIGGTPAVSVPNALTFTDWVFLNEGATLNTTATYTGTGAGAGSTGTKYSVNLNATAVLNSTTLPGATAGATATGGQVSP